MKFRSRWISVNNLEEIWKITLRRIGEFLDRCFALVPVERKIGEEEWRNEVKFNFIHFPRKLLLAKRGRVR